jgi:excisionase family DNA binding protein
LPPGACERCAGASAPGTDEPAPWAIRGADLLAWFPQRRPVPGRRLTILPAAAAAGVHPETVRRAIQARHLAATMEGGRWLIAPADLAAWRPRPYRKP